MVSPGSCRSQDKLADSLAFVPCMDPDLCEAAAPARGARVTSYLPHTAPVLKSLAEVSKEPCVSLDMGSNQFQKQGTFRNETESKRVIQTRPPTCPGPSAASASLQTQPRPPNCFSLERIQRQLRLGSP